MSKAGKKIIGALAEAVEVLERGEPLDAHFTVRTVELPDEPQAWPATAVRSLRARLGVSQALFANLIGVSTVLVIKWESGERKPSKLARRLLDEIVREPSRWVKLVSRPVVARKTAAKAS